ncbi:LysM peptidoglycan-binding domain-containing protein [Psychrobacillus glaciei]|uniref:LysM peptidoglycan-binding domain-containing protein n=1 Tax=Psychrobacillus glaciei TaxID=2283160 RepID=A0A5J6SJN0_9BACI|nr:3D domain-containing protein [Psychrobacillus glaciei]QFF97623.1 LysM peptidoglycan-binding domain-containing protein [Psychrobacillus glaciei]
MKKHIIALTAMVTLSVGVVGQASAATVHTVEKGDTLWAISKETNVSVQDLQEWNGLDTTVIYPSQQLKVEETTDTYKVVLGDTLFDIAKEHNLSVDDLMDSNHLTSDLIFPGDELVFEGTKTSQPKKSVVSVPTTHQSDTTKPAIQPVVKPVAKPVAQPVTKTAVQSKSIAKEITVSSTAYTASCVGCSGVTSTGIDLHANPNKKVISVDPTVIPLGSKVWVEGYGEAIAGDTGGSIKGNKIDIFFPTKESALNWGRKTVKVKVLN